jgi:hypothetical protein
MSFSGLALILGVANVNRISMDKESCIIIFCGLKWVYLLDATSLNSPEDKLNQRPRLEFVRKHARTLGWIRTLSLVVALYFALQMRLPKASWYFFAASAVCSWAYSVGFKGRRLKSHSLNKTWLIALAWTAGVYAAIWTLQGLDFYVVSEGLIMILLSLLFFDTALLDWRDRKGDLAHGVKSIYTEKGLSWKLHTAVALVILAVGFADLIHSEDWLSLKLAGSYLVTFIGVASIAFRSKSAAVFSFWVSSWRMAWLVPLLL